MEELLIKMNKQEYLADKMAHAPTGSKFDDLVKMNLVSGRMPMVLSMKLNFVRELSNKPAWQTKQGKAASLTKTEKKKENPK